MIASVSKQINTLASSLFLWDDDMIKAFEEYWVNYARSDLRSCIKLTEKLNHLLRLNSIREIYAMKIPPRAVEAS